jgi:hypothetical protein
MMRTSAQGDVHGIDALAGDDGLEVGIRRRLHAVALAKSSPLLGVVAHDDRELGGLFCMRERGKDRDLRDIPCADDGVTNAVLPCSPDHRPPPSMERARPCNAQANLVERVGTKAFGLASAPRR